jgi:hypothetical protein
MALANLAKILTFYVRHSLPAILHLVDTFLFNYLIFLTQFGWVSEN